MRVLLHYDMDHEKPGLDIVNCDEQDDVRFKELLPDAEVIWHVLRPLTAADMDRAPSSS